MLQYRKVYKDILDKHIKMNIKIIIACTFLSLVLSACGGGGQSNTDKITLSDNKKIKLQRSSSDASLKQSIKQLMLETYGKITPAIMYADTGTTNKGYSTTNTQESDVDEADRLKNDGSFLYVASSKKPSIKIFSIQNDEAILTSTTVVDTPDSQKISGLYLADNKLISLSGNDEFFWDQWFAPIYWNNRSTKLDFFNAKKGKLSKINSLKVDGQLISSRRIGNTLYIATRHTPFLKGLIDYPSTKEDVAKNRALIETASLADFLPDYAINGVNKGDVLSASNCFTNNYTESKSQQASIINILSIDLNDSTAKPQGTCYVGSAEALYVSSKSLYLATTQYSYKAKNNIAEYNSNITTDIHKFALARASITYKGSAQVEGHLGWKQDSKSFRMGENNDVLGVITYTGNNANSKISPAKLTLLKEDSNTTDTLKVLSTLPNNKHPEPLGKAGEQIYATRFLGNKAYLVTFKTTDPLYILDLSNPKDPFVAGELEIKGYSDYLHPINENLVLAIGKDAIEATSGFGDNRGAWSQGVKLALIDVSDPTAPYTRQQIFIGKRGTNTAVSYNHRAFTSFMQEDGDLRIALPISVHKNDTSSEGDTVNTNHQWQYDALYRYNINTFTGALSERTAIKANKSSPPADTYSPDWQSDRSVIIGDKIYYLHGDKFISRDW